MRIMDFLNRDAISVDLKAKNKKEAIEELVDLLIKAKKVEEENKDKIMKFFIICVTLKFCISIFYRMGNDSDSRNQLETVINIYSL